ncbi:Hypothetical_protein [Hexamita inflata]|uniref:Hypothetical_protein n=1 Tax=Hexamita inflata TaxID=28002 RepID=A0AA86UM19_9EUKA|nr:Hypothetical protein HINF_LOCUS44266 [Hexamita inflata]
MSVLMRRENTLIIEPGSDISKIQIINFILLPNSKKHFEGPPLYAVNKKYLEIKWDSTKSTQQSEINKLSDSQYDSIEIFGEGHQFDVSNKCLQNTSYITINFCQLNLDQISKIQHLRLRQCTCVGNFKDILINDLELVDIIPLKNQQFSSLKVDQVSIIASKTEFTSYIPIISHFESKLNSLDIYNQQVDLSLISGTWKQIRFTDCTCIYYLSVKVGNLQFINGCSIRMCQLQGGYNTLNLDLCPQLQHCALDLFSEPYLESGAKTLVLTEFDVNLAQLSGSWSSIVLKYCTLQNSAPNDTVIASLAIQDSHPMNSFTNSSTSSLCVQYTGVTLSDIQMQNGCKFEQIKLISSQINDITFLFKWNKIILTNCVLKIDGETKKIQGPLITNGNKITEAVRNE